MTPPGPKSGSFQSGFLRERDRGSRLWSRESSHPEGVRMVLQEGISALLRKGAYFAVSTGSVAKETPRSRRDLSSQCDARKTGIDRVRRF